MGPIPNGPLSSNLRSSYDRYSGLFGVRETVGPSSQAPSVPPGPKAREHSPTFVPWHARMEGENMTKMGRDFAYVVFVLSHFIAGKQFGSKNRSAQSTVFS